MQDPSGTMPREAAEVLGASHPLVEQLGSTEGLVTLSAVSASLRLGRVDGPVTLRLFLEAYRSQILLPLELPVIQCAYFHATANEVRELIAFDEQLVHEPLLRDFASASRRVGRAQLRRLRPLRGQRLVPRYLAAIDEGRAHGWHTVVYGVTLSLYSLPLRQGLLNYGHQTLRGFIHSAAQALRLSEKEGRQLLETVLRELPAGVDAMVSANNGHALRVV